MRIYLGYLFIFIAALCWGVLGVFGRIAMSGGVAPLEVAFWRALFAGIFMLTHAICIKDAKVHSIKHLGVFVLFGVFSIATFFGAGQYAIRDGGVALASVLLYTAPAWVALFSRMFFGIALTKITFLGILIALAGVACISFSAGNTGDANTIGKTLPIMGIFFGLLTGFLYATHFIVTKKYLTIYSPFTLYGYASIIAAISIAPFIEIRINFSSAVWLALLGISFISTYIAYWIYCEGMKILDPTKASIIANFEPAIATFAAWYIWGESFTFFGWVGALLILATVFILLIDEKNRNRITN